MASELSTSGPGARFTVDAVLEFNGSLGPGSISGVGFDLATIPSVNFPVNYTKTIIDIGSGSSSLEIPAGPYGTVTLGVPDILELSSNALIPPELAKLKATGAGEERFANFALDLDAVAVSLFGLPPNLLGDEYVIASDGTGDGRPDLSIAYELLNVNANLGLKFAQQFTFMPTSIGVIMTSNSGEVKTGVLGDTFTFTAPTLNGEFGVSAEFTLNGNLQSQTGVVLNGSLQVQAGKFVLHNEYGPDFDINLASLVTGEDYLYDQEFPEGGFDIGSPLYVFDSSFALGGFEKSMANYTIQVVPEASSVITSFLLVGGLVLSAYARRVLRISL